MERKLIGVGLLAGALVVLAVSSAVRATVAGEAVAEPVPPPPAVGACVLAPFPSEVGSDPIGLREQTTIQLDTNPGACEGVWYGEVVEVYGPEAADRSDVALLQECYSASQRYMGVPDSTFAGISWSFPDYLHVELIRPTNQQTAAGQDWIACAIGQSVFQAEQPWSVSVAASWPNHPRFRDVSACTDAFSDGGYTGITCDRPHRVQVLGYGDPQRPEDQAALNRSCRDLAAAVTLLSDPTAAGQLTLTAQTDANVTACLVSPADPDVRLTASLTGLGDSAPPLG